MARRLRANARYTAQIKSSVGIEFLNAADKAAFDSQLIARDVGIISIQLAPSPAQFFILRSHVPVVWDPLAAGVETFTKAVHAALPPTDAIHTTISLEFPDAATRNAFSGVAADVGKDCLQLDTGDIFKLKDLVPTWIQIGGGGGVTSHLSLTNLTTGDAGHDQFLLMPGRVGGQTASGGVGAGENLTLRSTVNATKGIIFCDSTVNITGDVVAQEGVFGDIVLSSPDKGARWRIKEHADRVAFLNEMTGVAYRLPLQHERLIYRWWHRAHRLIAQAILLYVLFRLIGFL